MKIDKHTPLSSMILVIKDGSPLGCVQYIDTDAGTCVRHVPSGAMRYIGSSKVETTYDRAIICPDEFGLSPAKVEFLRGAVDIISSEELKELRRSLEKTVRCTDCRCEFTDEETEGRTSCPKCGTISVPMRIKDDVTIRINLHELRLLTIFAMNWAEDQCGEDTVRTLNSVLDQLRKQNPGVGLTLRDDIQEVANALGTKAVLHRAGTAEVIDPEDKN